MKHRPENFGGIVSINKPPMLVYLNKPFYKLINRKAKFPNSKHQTAPNEVHYSITNKCPMNCPNCYVDGGKEIQNELSLPKIKKAIDILAEKKVFHIAFGGGEALAHPNFFEIVNYAKEKGLVPNLTTNGYYVKDEIGKKFKIFGQIHVSLDGLEDYYKKTNTLDQYKIRVNALKVLVKHHKKVGINVVVNRYNFDQLESIIKFAKKLKLYSILLLRYKPAGRAINNFDEYKLTNEQNISLYHKILGLIRKYRINIHTDCSFMPFICYHNPSKRIINYFAIRGCEGGNIIMGLMPDGSINACSFANETTKDIFDYDKVWNTAKDLTKYRQTKKTAKHEPCASCDYFKYCHGGCHALTETITGDFFLPDPECPKVIEYNNKK